MDIILWLQAIILGLVQGITEFLPISSTAHLILFSDLLGWKSVWHKTALDAMQFGSVIAVFGYFWQDIRQIGQGPGKHGNSGTGNGRNGDSWLGSWWARFLH